MAKRAEAFFNRSLSLCNWRTCFSISCIHHCSGVIAVAMEVSLLTSPRHWRNQCWKAYIHHFNILGHRVLVLQNQVDTFLLELMGKRFSSHSHLVSAVHYISNKVSWMIGPLMLSTVTTLGLSWGWVALWKKLNPVKMISSRYLQSLCSDTKQWLDVITLTCLISVTENMAISPWNFSKKTL